MTFVECDAPATSMLDRKLVQAACFSDCFRAPLRRSGLPATDIFLAIFAHHPWWMKLALVIRNKAASLAGLDAPSASAALRIERKDRYAVGDTIGVWPIFALSNDEVVAARNNKHLDFRVSVLKARDGDASNVTVSTICVVNNLLGKIYLSAIIPFHRYGVRKLMTNALAAGRL